MCLTVYPDLKISFNCTNRKEMKVLNKNDRRSKRRRWLNVISIQQLIESQLRFLGKDLIYWERAGVRNLARLLVAGVMTKDTELQ